MPYRILSLTGGGIRGIFQAVYLRHLADRLRAPLSSNFDLIVGTSTGAIIAAAVALDVDPDRVVSLFQDWGPKIFRRSRWWFLRRGPCYAADPLREALHSVFEDKKLKDCRTPVAIAATALEHYKCRVFSYLREDDTLNDFDGNLSVVDVLMASCAAPAFFAPVRPAGETRTFVDGGLWANSPSLLGVVYAHRCKRVAFRDMRLVAVGNGELAAGAGASAFLALRPLSVRLIATLLDMMFAVQSDMSEQAATIFLGEERVASVKPRLDYPIALNDVPAALERLPALAQQMAFNESKRVLSLLTESQPPPPPGPHRRVDHSPLCPPQSAPPPAEGRDGD